MNILAIETATTCCSVALLSDDDVCVQRQDSPGAHSGQVLGMVRTLLQQRKLCGYDLDLVAVDVGPGSFTGLRIGIGVAQGFAYSQALPTIGIGSLSALASAELERPVVAALDARMQQVYWAMYQGSDVLLPPQVGDPESIAEALREHRLVEAPVCVGNGWDAYPERMPRSLAGKPIEVHGSVLPDATQIARLALAADSRNYLPPLALSAAYVRNNVAEKPSR